MFRINDIAHKEVVKYKKVVPEHSTIVNVLS